MTSLDIPVFHLLSSLGQLKKKLQSFFRFGAHSSSAVIQLQISTSIKINQVCTVYKQANIVPAFAFAVITLPVRCTCLH